METISKDIRRQIFAELPEGEELFGQYKGYDGPLTFLNKVWPLREMKSEDGRYKNAYDDTRQHYINNSDWTWEYLFLQRFQLVDGSNESFVLFLEAVVSPDVRNDADEINEYAQLINRYLNVTGVRLFVVDYFERLPVYKVMDQATSEDLPTAISVNSIPFYLSEGGIVAYPCFVLIYDRWNDYAIITQMRLEFRSAKNESISFGDVKIMKKGSKETWDDLPSTFTNLGSQFCSLGQTEDYYLLMKEHFPANYQGILYALRDVAIFPKIAEQFESDDTFKTSLIRYNSVETLMRTIRFKLNGIDLTDAFKFTYVYQPPYADNEITINFDFDYTSILHHRVFALIGKNGTGKTRILSSLASSLGYDAPKNIFPRKPLHGKIFTISYSFFDRNEIPQANAAFNYVYCGLKRPDGSWYSKDELTTTFLASGDKITYKKMGEDWYETLLLFIPHDILDLMFSHRRDFIPEAFNDVYNKLSSGQNILIFIITEILAQIRTNSLILYDEPETHLHPNAISELMNTIFAIVEKFDSFCILATHSPIVIQEVQSRDIYVLDRVNDRAIVRRLEKESFGENLSIISEDIFGNREIPKYHLSLLARLVRQGKTMGEIVELFEYDNLPLSLSARLYIKNLIAERQ